MSYQPYMFGGSTGYSNSATSFNQAQQQQRGAGQGRVPQESVRDCMYWPLSLNNTTAKNSTATVASPMMMQAQGQGDHQVAAWSSMGGAPGNNSGYNGECFTMTVVSA